MTPITTEQLEAIRQRTEKASAGPWHWRDNDGLAEVFNGGEYIANELYVNDAEFITKARTDIPTLLAEIDRLRRQNHELFAELRQKDELKAENERLQKQNDKYYDVLAELEYRIDRYRHYGLKSYIEGWDSDD